VARFAARHANYGHGIREGRYSVLKDGQRHELQKGLFAQFRRGLLTEQEENVAIAGLTHLGLPIDRDTEEHFSPRSRISGFDTVIAQEENYWTDEERELVEETLRKSPHLNQAFIELAAAKAEKPWPLYDNAPDAQTIVDMAELAGIPFESVAAYERENQNRPEVLAALSGQRDEDEDEVVLIEA
jgi:hypothetical protein